MCDHCSGLIKQHFGAIKLKELCDEAVADPAFAPKDGVTHCNQAVKRIAKAVGCGDFKDGDMADDMIVTMATSWEAGNGQTAFLHASHGGLAVAAHPAKPHGHVAVIYPAEMQTSPSLCHLVPLVANVGGRNGIMRVTEAFEVKNGEPDYYLWTSTD